MEKIEAKLKSSIINSILEEDHICHVGPNWQDSSRKVAILFGFSKWKCRFICDYLKEYRVLHVLKKTPWPELRACLETMENFEIFVWSYTERGTGLENYAREKGIDLIHVENGFLAFLDNGRDHPDPYSMFFDRKGLYFNSSEASQLEDILNQASFDCCSKLMRQAHCLLNLYKSMSLGRINTVSINSVASELGVKYCKRVLVLGQRKDDILSAYGNAADWTPEKLLELAIAENPGALILFLPPRDSSEGNKKRLFPLESLRQYENVRILEQSLVLGELFAACDHVYTITSSDGFEALLHGLKVTVTGMPFYAGWGLTDDRQTNARRRRKLSIEEIFCGVFLLYQKYIIGSGDPVTDCLAAMLRIHADGRHALLDLFTEDFIAKNFASLAKSEYWPVLLRNKHLVNNAEKNRELFASVFPIRAMCKKGDPQLWQRIIAFAITGKIIGKPAFYPFICDLENHIDLKLYKEIIQKLLSVYPSDYFIYRWGQLCGKEGQPALAYEAFLQALEFDSETKFNPPVPTKKFGYMLALARYEKDMRKLEKALEHYFTLLLSGYCAPEVLIDLAEIATLRFDFDTANRLYDTLAIMQPAFRSGWLNMQAARNAAAMPNESCLVIKYLSIACHAAVTYVCSDFFGFNGNDEYFNNMPLQEALSYIKTEARQDKISLAYALATIGKAEKAEEILNSLDPSQANIIRYCTTKAMALTLQGKYGQAMALLLDLRKNAPFSSVYHEILRAGIEKEDYELCGRIVGEAEQRNIPIAEPYKRKTFYGNGDIANGYRSYKDISSLTVLQPYLGNKHASSLSEISVADNSVFIIPCLGPGDEITSARFYRNIVRQLNEKDLHFGCEPRLLPLMRRSFPDLVFHPVKRRRTLYALDDLEDYNDLPGSDLITFFDNSSYRLACKFDRTILSINCIADFFANGNLIDDGAYLQADMDAVAKWRERIKKIANGRPAVGLSWRSSLMTYGRNQHFLTIQQLGPLFELDDILFVNLQYDECNEELACAEKNYPGRLINFSDLDKFNDLDGTAALISALDLVITPGTVIHVLSGSLGRPTFLYTNSGEVNWLKRKGSRAHIMHDSVRLISGNPIGDKTSLARNLVKETEKFFLS